MLWSRYGGQSRCVFSFLDSMVDIEVRLNEFCYCLIC